MDLSGVRARRDYEIVFQLAFGSVIDNVDAGVHALGFNSAELWNFGNPLRAIIALVIAAETFLRLGRVHCGGHTRAGEIHVDRLHVENELGWVVRPEFAFQIFEGGNMHAGQNRAFIRDENCRATAAAHIPDLRIGLAHVGFKMYGGSGGR
jgi:hypothetical protein